VIKLIHLLTEILENRGLSTIRKVRDELVATDPTNLRDAGSRKDRIFAPNTTPEQFKELIKAKYKLSDDDIEVIDAKASGSLSSQFPTFNFKVNGSDISIVLAKGVSRGEKGELAQASNLQKQLAQALQANGGSVKIKIGTLEPIEITKGIVQKIPGNLMADLSIDDKVFIQIKEERFQQLSGLIKTSTYVNGTDLVEINSFIDAVKTATGGEMKPSQGFKRIVESESLARPAVFGNINAPFSKDHIQLNCKGHLKLVELDGFYTIQGSSEANTLAVTDDLKKGDQWWPYMVAKYSDEHNQKGITHCRFNFGTANFIPKATII